MHVRPSARGRLHRHRPLRPGRHPWRRDRIAPRRRPGQGSVVCPVRPGPSAAAAVAVALSPITQEGEDALNAAVNTLDVPTVQAVLNQHLVTAELIRMELILLNFNFGNKMNSEKSKKVDAMRKFLEAQHDELQKTLPEINPTLSDDEVQKQLQKAIKVGNQFEAQQALNKVKAILDRCRVTLPVFKNVYTSYRLAAEPWQHHPTIREIGELLRDFAKKNNYPWGD